MKIDLTIEELERIHCALENDEENLSRNDDDDGLVLNASLYSKIGKLLK